MSECKLAMEYAVEDDPEDIGETLTGITKALNDKLIAYINARLSTTMNRRENRVRRYANIDQSLSTWQQLSPENSERKNHEEQTGIPQALPVNLPLAKSYVEDTAAFCAEIFAPLAGNFYANPSAISTAAPIGNLAKRLNDDSKANGYYAQIAHMMQSLFRYNLGGGHIEYISESTLEMTRGNRLKSIDVYNVIYDNAVTDMQNLHKDAEFVALPEIKSRTWLIRKHRKTPIQFLEEIIGERESAEANTNDGSVNSAKYYCHPPSTTMIPEDGEDSKSSVTDGSQRVNWQSFGLGLDSDSRTPIDGHEVMTVYMWLNENQFGLSESGKNNVALYRFVVVDAKWVIDMEPMPEKEEIPVYMARVNPEALGEAARSYGEMMISFSRLASFQINTYIDGIRSDIYGLTVVDPTAIDITTLKKGNVAGVLQSKIPGRDIRTAIQTLRTDTSNSRQQFADAGTVMDLARQFFPNQGLPAQVAGIDRAVTNQVAAVMQGAMRKMHMVARVLNDTLMLQQRKAQCMNLIENERADLLGVGDIPPEELLALLDSGMAQLNREMAMQMLEKLVFTLLQNPEAIQTAGIDMSKLLYLFSMMMNINTNLADFRREPSPEEQAAMQAQAAGGAGAGGPPVDPGQPVV